MKPDEVITAVEDATKKKPEERKRVPGNLEIALFDSDIRYGGIDEKGQAYVRRRADVFDQPTSIGDTGQVTGFQYELPIKLGSQKLLLPLGLTVLTGPTAGGKSTFLRHLESQVPIDRVLAVEPHDEPSDIEAIPFFVTVDAAMMFLIGRQRAALGSGTPAIIPVIDSLRAAVFETEGAAGERGMVMRFFTTLTRISSTLARNGLSMLATVNPLQSDSATVAAFIDRLKSSVPCVIELNNTSRGADTITFSGAVSVRPKRDARSFSETWPLKPGAKPEARKYESFNFSLPEDSVVEPLSAPERNSLRAQTI